MNALAQLLEPEVRSLIAERRYADLRKALGELDPVDIADVLDNLPDAEAAIAFRMLPRESAGDAFAHLDHDRQERLIAELRAEGALRVVEAMEPDDRVELLDELPAAVARRLIGAMSPENRRITREIMGYPVESVGRLMTPDYVRVHPDWTMTEAIAHIREHGRDAETIHWVYVVDDDGRLVDDLHIRSLLLADPDATIRSLMDSNFISLRAREDREEAVRMMSRYDRTALPVTDAGGRLVGIVTVDDVADVAEMEATEDIHKIAGVAALGQPYTSLGLVDMIKKRWPWLAVLFVGEIGTILVLSQFEHTLESTVVLALFIPLIISTGGNSGGQAATLVIRALALDEVSPRSWLRIVRRELATGLCMGIGLGILAAATVLVLHAAGQAHSPAPLRLGVTIAVAVTAVVVWGTMIGSLLPLALQRFGLDPATSSTPLVATLMDSLGMITYFTVAAVIFGSL